MMERKVKGDLGQRPPKSFRNGRCLIVVVVVMMMSVMMPMPSRCTKR